MANGRRRDLKREQFWRDICQRQTDSGLSAAVFCADLGVTAQDLYRWRSVLRRRDQASGQHNAEVRPTPHAPDVGLPAFVPVRVQGMLDSETITIDLRGGRVVRLPISLGMERVAALALLLEGGAA